MCAGDYDISLLRKYRLLQMEKEKSFSSATMSYGQILQMSLKKFAQNADIKVKGFGLKKVDGAV